MTPERQKRFIDVLSKRQGDLTVILENVHDPHNIYAVMRTCDAIGIGEIYILYTKPTHALIGRKSSGSARKWIKENYFMDRAACFEAVKSRYDRVIGTHLGEASEEIYDLDLSQSTAFLFGNEKDGVTQESLALCDGNMHIPQFGMIKSLNISVACAVTLYEALRQRKEHGSYNRSGKESLVSEELETLEAWTQREFDRKKSK